MRLQGQVTGAQVEIRVKRGSATELLFAGIAGAADEAYDLSRALQPGEVVFARQSKDDVGFSPDVPADGETVQPGPDAGDLGPLSIDAHYRACSRCIALANAYPGALVTIESATRGVLGTASAEGDGGVARIALSAQLLQGEGLSAAQSACGIPGPVTPLPVPEWPARLGSTLPSPLLPGPILGCDGAVYVEGVTEGATVTLHRDGTPPETACFDYPASWFRLSRPVMPGDSVAADQRFDACEVKPSRPSGGAPVVPADPVPPLSVAPLCMGAPRVHVAGLRPGAMVRIHQGAHEVGGGEAWAAECDFVVDPLDSSLGHTLVVEETLCDGRSTTVRAEIWLEMLIGRPELPFPVVECARVVRVGGLVPGSIVEVHMTMARGQERLVSPRVVATRPEMDVPVAGLVPDRDVWARVAGCSTTLESGRVKVHQLGDLRAPTVVDCGSEVRLSGCVPGIRGEVYLDGQYLAGGVGGSDQRNFPLPAPLSAGQLTGRQLAAGRISPFGPPFTVRGDVDKTSLEWRSTEWIAQLTGNEDKNGVATRSQTGDAGVDKTDLGTSVDYPFGGTQRSYFFFGDTWETHPAADAMAWSDDPAPDPRGLLLHVVTPPDDDDYKRLVIPGVSLEGFETPCGAFFHDNRIYVFACTDHFTMPDIANPARNPNAPPGKDENFVGRSVMARSGDVGGEDPFAEFPLVDEISLRADADWAYLWSNRHGRNPGGFKFINVSPCKIQNDDVPGLPATAPAGGEGLVIAGSGLYRMSQPYLAYVPLSPGQDPRRKDWWFLRGFDRTPFQPGLGPCGRPLWSQNELDAVAVFDDPVVGELSLGWIGAAQRWVLLYLRPPSTVALRSARWPWGPWSDPVVIFDAGRDGGQRFIDTGGTPYAPYLIHRFTQWDSWSEELTLFYTMSTWVPYQVSLMKTVLALTCGYRECP